MPEFNIRTDAVDVEQIMRQIRARIREKRGVDYTEEQIQELASVKLERFLDPKGVRSDLVEQFRRRPADVDSLQSLELAPLPPFELPPAPPKYEFEDFTMYESPRGFLRLIRRVLQPVLKLFINPNPLIRVLNLQSTINAANEQRFQTLEGPLRRLEEPFRNLDEHFRNIRRLRVVRDDLDALYYEVVHNLVLEITRLGIEMKNLKMRVESISGRLDFDERRARALEGVVQYRPGVVGAGVGTPSGPPSPGGGADATDEESPADTSSRRRRRRRRGRRGRGSTPAQDGVAPSSSDVTDEGPVRAASEGTADARSVPDWDKPGEPPPSSVP